MWVLLLAGFMVAAPSPLETARDAEDRPALEKMVSDYSAAAARAPKDAEAQYRGAPRGAGPPEPARDAEGRPALEKRVSDYSAAAARAPKDAEAQYRGALACS